MKPALSIIICAHNPRRDYLERVLQALKEQSLPKEFWELLLIDNASNQILSEKFDLSWHSNARHIKEVHLGLTHARIRGIKEAAAEVLVFVDDDNVLDLSYLEAAWRISKDWPMIGAWGGQVIPDFENTPPEWTKPYWWMLAIREFDQDKWSNLIQCYDTIPIGAGMCLRKCVADKYIELVSNSSVRLNLDPKGKQLLRGGDIDLAFTSCDIGLGTGIFVSLKVTHLIPVSRLKEDYLLKLAEGIAYSNTVVEYFRGKTPNLPRFSNLLTVLKYIYYNFVLKDSRTWRFNQAFSRGKALAIQELIKK